MADLELGEIFAVDPLDTVEIFARGQGRFEHSTAVDLVGSWLGEYMVGQIAGVDWVEAVEGWRLQAGEQLFDPFSLADSIVSNLRGLSTGLFMMAMRSAIASTE